MVTLALTVLTSSQGLLIAASKANGVEYSYAVTSANCTVEFVKLIISFVALVSVWSAEGVNPDNTLKSSFSELAVYPIPAGLYLVKNLMQYYIFYWTDAPSYQILKNLNIISTGILYRLFLQKPLTGVQWAALALLGLGCATAQLSTGTDSVLSTPVMGLLMAVVMAILSGAAGVYTELIMKTRPQRNINVQNVYLYAFGVLFNLGAIYFYDYDAVVGKGYFYGYSTLVYIMIANHALSGIAVSLVMKFADNIVKVYSTSVAMILTTLVSIPLFGFELTLPFVLGTAVVCVATYLHYQSKMK
jgi:UDP-sugar transporter A1/2/3|tara:strand:+ start:3501 stop:4406 length:906 start_codon:yes stop_codon:yes gene_type:complete